MKNKVVASLVLCLLVALAISPKAHAEYINETVSDISVPGNVLWGVQGEWQGHIIYEVIKTNTGYRAKVVRDGEPHQYPYFYLEFDSNWNFIGRSQTIVPRQPEIKKPEKPAEPSKPEPKPEPQPQPEPEPEAPTPEPPSEPENPREEEPPVTKPPEEEPEEEDEEPDTED